MIHIIRSLLFLIVLCCCVQLHAQSQTIVRGVVTDGESEIKEALAFANVFFTGTTNGVTTDLDGGFVLVTDDLTLDSISGTYLGYEEKFFTIVPGQDQTINFELAPASNDLQEIVVVAKRPKKDTAAITLYRNIVRNKRNNRSDSYDQYSFEQYTKTEFDIFNVGEAFQNRKVLKPFNFIFDNVDTTEAGQTYLPTLFREQMGRTYHRSSPKKKTVRTLDAEKFSGIEDMNLSGLVDFAFDDINLYNNVILLGGQYPALSPFANGALISYRYYLADSAVIGDKWCYKLEFAPKRKGDLAFTGFAWIHDSTFALVEVDVALDTRANINYVQALDLRQSYTRMNGKHWFKTGEEFSVRIGVTKSKKLINARVLRTASRAKITINEPLPDSIFSGDTYLVEKSAFEQDQSYWQGKRHVPLTAKEAQIYTMVDQVQETKAYKRYRYAIHSAATGHFRAGPIEFGPFLNAFSWNALEGNRFRIGGRTNRKMFRDKLDINGYLAYGTKDKLLKYHASGRFHLKRPNRKWHMVGLSYTYDWSDYNNRSAYITHDHIIGALMRRTPLDNLFLQRSAYLFYDKEWVRGFTTNITGLHKSVYSWPESFVFETTGGDTTATADNRITTLELGVGFSWSVGQKFMERGFERVELTMSAPSLTANYKFTPKGWLGSDVSYHTVGVGLRQEIRHRLGRTDYEVTAGKIIGDVPLPFLKYHKGNENFFYNRHLFNIMRDFEYVSDEWVEFSVRHRFGGKLLNTIPGVSRLKMRSMVYFKGVTGRVSPRNQAFLQDPEQSLTQVDNWYGEVGVGVENIAKLLRLYFVWRVTQRDQTDVQKFGIKFYISPSF